MSLLCLSKLFLKSFIVFEFTIWVGSSFHLFTTLFVKNLWYLDLFANFLTILKSCPLSLLFVEKSNRLSTDALS